MKWHSGLKDEGVMTVPTVTTEMTPSTEREPAEKATLFCPECGHESRINGDWVIHVLVDSTTYECPDCATTINSQQNQDALIAGSSGSLRFAAED
jgi:predicted RNA-binding Zn-ribbon protein involved in translation (DUF1610 family)